MPSEIERKFLCSFNEATDSVNVVDVKRISQGYLSNGDTSAVRVRVSNESGYITVKSKRIGNVCDEYEYEIPLSDALSMLELSVTPLVVKTRYVVRDQFGQRWDVDSFTGINDGLKIAEIELDHPDQDVQLPSWVGTEVSHDKRFSNTYLAEYRAPLLTNG